MRIPYNSTNTFWFKHLPLTVLLIFFFGTVSFSFNKSGLSFTLCAGTQSLTVPWYLDPVVMRFNPAFSIGAEYPIKSWKRIALYESVNAGFLQHYWWMSALYMDTEFGAGFLFPFGLRSDITAGLGYMHYFFRRKTMVLRDGEYIQEADWGKPSVMVPLSIVLGYSGKPGHTLLFAPFLSMKWIVQGTFMEEIPAMTHMLVSAGVRMHFPQTRVLNHE
jgi:hypothetical protein